MTLKSIINFAIFPEYIKKKLRIVNLISCGYHNCSFKGYYNRQKVQIRIATNNFVNWENEHNFIKNNSNFLYYYKGNFIKKWIEGKVLDSENLNTHLDNLFLTILEFHRKKNDIVAKFDWQIDVIKDEKYINLVKKYQFDSLVISHNDLQFKNIIVSEKNVFLIDFEWIRLNNPYFDYACLHTNLGILPEEIIKFFNLEVEKFNDFVYLVTVFTNFWNKKFYNKSN
ncbi:hypothetical protein [Mesomycoplasma flocculare]|uniref:hypothetical protein n=1 Tax=Mesomycoplasma flocculare TaxID=2128 RepID=UPI0013701F42|nr:hypothetical protein [Mesomycoplasma flocculare]MXR13552.1 hypothetical protein [Mesomycoplasma flocculare]MXR23012.1 hypothetical protein [Mesomycoplasma flocculare]